MNYIGVSTPEELLARLDQSMVAGRDESGVIVEPGADEHRELQALFRDELDRCSDAFIVAALRASADAIQLRLAASAWSAASEGLQWGVTREVVKFVADVQRLATTFDRYPPERASAERSDCLDAAAEALLVAHRLKAAASFDEVYALVLDFAFFATKYGGKIARRRNSAAARFVARLRLIAATAIFVRRRAARIVSTHAVVVVTPPMTAAPTAAIVTHAPPSLLVHKPAPEVIAA